MCHQRFGHSSLFKQSANQSQPASRKGSDRVAVWCLLPRTRDNGSYFMGVSSSQERMALVKGKTQKCSNEARDFFLLVGHMARILDSCELERWAILAWNARNKFYFEHKQVHPSLILNGAYGLLDEYQRLMQPRVKGAHGFSSCSSCGAWCSVFSLVHLEQLYSLANCMQLSLGFILFLCFSFFVFFWFHV